MAWNGDISKMGQLAENIARLDHVPAKASAKIAKGIERAIKEEFRDEKDPYGVPWHEHSETTTARHGAHDILDLSGEMRKSLDVFPRAGAGVAITIDHPAEDHQTGWDGPQGSGPARPILPGGAMPQKWRNIVSRAIGAEVDETLKRKKRRSA